MSDIYIADMYIYIRGGHSLACNVHFRPSAHRPFEPQLELGAYSGAPRITFGFYLLLFKKKMNNVFICSIASKHMLCDVCAFIGSHSRFNLVSRQFWYWMVSLCVTFASSVSL